MITIHREKETDFEKNGFGAIDNYIVNPEVDWEMNGKFQLSFAYPSFLEKSVYLKNKNIVRAPVPFMQDQLFRIYRTRKVLGFIEVEARHIFYDLLDNLIEDTNIVGKNGQVALQQLLGATQYPHRFMGLSDIETINSARMVRYNPIEALLDDSISNTFVSRWGGELVRDNFTIRMAKQMGTDRGVHIQHKKDLTGYEATIDESTVVTRIMPIGFDGLKLPELYVDSPLIDLDNPKIHVIKYDDVKAAVGEYANDEDAVPIENAYNLLRQYANEEYSVNHLDEPETVVSVDFVTLHNTLEYKEFASLQEIQQGDVVKVSIPDEGFEITSRLVAFTSDPLQKNRYTSTTLGNHVFEFTTSDNEIVKIRNDVNTLQESVVTVMQAANGKNSNFSGTDDPNALNLNANLGDNYTRFVGEEKILYQYVELNGERYWAEITNTGDLDRVSREVEAAIAEIDDVRQSANEAVDKVNANELAIFGKLDLSVYETNKTIVEAELNKKLATATYTAQKQTQDALIAGKVAIDTYNTKVTELNSLITEAQTTADTAAADLLKKADTATVNTELAKKLATSTYNTKMASLDTAISGHNTRIKATEDGLALTATKVEVDDVRTRMTEAETEIGQNSDAIALKASQSSLDTTNGKLATAEATLVVQAGQIASKVSQTDFNALNGRVGTAESSITQQASQIASKVSQTDFDSLSGRVGTAESSISQQAGEIALRVTTATYNAGIGSKENTITKSTTAPAHLNGRLWLDTSVTPNVLKRSTGSVWVKVTPTTPGEVGAYSAGDGSALAGRVSTAETSITANTTAINLRATKTDLDAAKGRLTTAEGTISVQAGQIALKANQTTVDTLTGRVGTAETNISANTTAINLRATKTSVDTLTGRVTTAEGTITTQAGQIALRATTATVNALTGRVSTAETNISANTTAINLRATKTELTTAIDGIEVGGRNLLYDLSSMEETIHGVTLTYSNGKITLNGTCTTSVNFTKDFSIDGGTYTLSSNNPEIAPNAGTRIDVYGVETGLIAAHMNTVDASRTGTLNSGAGTFRIRIEKGATYTNFELTPKLEKGNKATDWTPAPEDVDAAISTVQSDLTVEAGKITALTTRVSGAESNITSVTQTVSGINTTISTLRTDVDGKATIVALNQVKSTADGNKTTISNHAGRLTTVETNVNGLQTTVASKADQSQVTQLSNSISSTVSSAINDLEIGGRNYLLNYNGSEYSVSNNTTTERYVYPSDSNAGALPTYITLIPNTEYTLSVWARSNLSTARTMDMFFVHASDDTQHRAKTGLQLYTYYSEYVFTFTTGQNSNQQGYIRFDLNGSPNTGLAIMYTRLAKLERGNKVTDWSPAPEDMATTSQITQLNSAINLRVTKGELMSQINVEAGRTLISSSRLYLDSDTVVFSGRAFIPDAAITEINAAKITTGTLNAAYVNVININVANIVGNTSSFIQSNWNGINTNISITSNELTATDGSGNRSILNSSGQFRSHSGSDGTYGIFEKGRIWFYDNNSSAVLNMGSHPISGISGHQGAIATARARRLYIGRYNDYLTSNLNATVNPYISLEYGGTVGDENNVFTKIWTNLSMNGRQINDVQYISGYELNIHSSAGRLFLGVPTHNTLQIALANTRSYGDIEMMQSYAVIGTSDERLKNSITPTTISGLEVVNALEYYDYYWNDRPEIGKQFGLIAQRSPFVAEQNSDSGYWGINMNKLSLVTAKAVKEVDTKVTRIDTYVSQHELEIKILKERIRQLEEEKY